MGPKFDREGNPELLATFKTTIRDYGTFIVPLDEELPALQEGASPIDRLGALRQHQVSFTHLLRERMRFISSHPQLMESFRFHMERAQRESAGGAAASAPPAVSESGIEGVD